MESVLNSKAALQAVTGLLHSEHVHELLSTLLQGDSTGNGGGSRQVGFCATGFPLPVTKGRGG